MVDNFHDFLTSLKLFIHICTLHVLIETIVLKKVKAVLLLHNAALITQGATG